MVAHLHKNYMKRYKTPLPAVQSHPNGAAVVRALLVSGEEFSTHS